MLMMIQRCLNFARIVAQRWTEVAAVRLIDADTAADFAENCGATFVAKRLRDSKAFPDVVTRCKDCAHSTLPSELTQRYGKPGTLTCHNRYSPCNRRNVGEVDFCSYGERREE